MVNHETSPPAWRPYLFAAALLTLAGAALLIDVPLANFFVGKPPSGQTPAVRVPSDVKKILTLSEVFGHASGVTLLCLAWFVLDRPRRWSLPRLIACAYGAGLLADLVKVLVGRSRPNAGDLSSGVAESFVGFVPALHASDWSHAINRDLQSFPSGHSAMAAGLAVVLGSFYPHARWVFALFAGLVMFQRVESGAHFLSDTLAGAALGCLWAGFCLDPRVFGRPFDRLEAR